MLAEPGLGLGGLGSPSYEVLQASLEHRDWTSGVHNPKRQELGATGFLRPGLETENKEGPEP